MCFSDNYKHTRRKESDLREHSLGDSNIYSLKNQTLYFNNKNHNTLHHSDHISHRHNIHKRSASLKRHVEIMVAADYGMYRYHGRDLEKYILTLMGIVSILHYLIFSKKSLFLKTTLIASVFINYYTV